jgi:hypothetical protein
VSAEETDDRRALCACHLQRRPTTGAGKKEKGQHLLRAALGERVARRMARGERESPWQSTPSLPYYCFSIASACYLFN